MARENNTQGMVVIIFVVYSNGVISDIYVEKDIGDGCGMAAVDVVQSFNAMEEK